VTNDKIRLIFDKVVCIVFGVILLFMVLGIAIGLPSFLWRFGSCFNSRESQDII